MFAIGRRALTKDLKLENAGVKVVPENGKIDAQNEQTNVPHIFAIGDVLHVSSIRILIKNYSSSNAMLLTKYYSTEKARAYSSSHPRRKTAGQKNIRKRH